MLLEVIMSDKQDTREMLVSGNVFKTMLTLSVPAVLGMVVIGLYNFMDAVFVGQMVGPVAMTAVKVSYPFTLIKVLGAENGVLGAAFATIISQFVLMCMSFFYFIKKSETVRIHKIRFEGKLVKPVLGVGVSAMLMQVMSMVQQTILYNTAAKWGGSEWQTILGAALSLQAFAFIPLWGISQGFQPAIGTNYGAKLFDRVGAFTRTFMISATVVALLFYVPIMCFPVKMLSMFITDAAIVQTGAPMLRVIFGAYICYGVLILSITFFQAIGKAGGASILALARQLVLFLPLVVILPHVAGLGVKGVFYAQLITDLVVLLLAIILMIKAFRGFKKN